MSSTNSKIRIPLTVDQVAERYGFPKSSIYKLHHEGKIKGYKPFGRRLIFDQNELDEVFYPEAEENAA